MSNYRKIQMAAVAAAVMITMMTVAGASEAATRKATLNTRASNSAVSTLKARTANALWALRYYMTGEDEGFPSPSQKLTLPRLTR